MTLVDAKNESFDDANKTYEKAKEILRKHPDIAGFQGSAGNDVIGIGRAVEEAGLAGKVCVVGTGLATPSAKLIESGAITAIGFWDPKDAGLAMNKTAKLLLDKQPLTNGMSLGVKGYEKVTVTKGAGSGVLIVGNAMVIADKSTYKTTCSKTPTAKNNTLNAAAWCGGARGVTCTPRRHPMHAAQSQESARSASASSVFLEVSGIHKRFGGVHALRGVGFVIERGQIYHLLGENGCGKSTLIKIISGAQPPDEGQIVIEGRAHSALTPIESLSAGIETVYQDLSLIPNLTVAENVALTEQLVQSRGSLARPLRQAELNATARRALAAVNLPTSAAFLSTPVGTLPLAVRQLVAISRAIATQA